MDILTNLLLHKEPRKKVIRILRLKHKNLVCIRESVDSLCRDGADTPMPPYIGKAFTRTNF